VKITDSQLTNCVADGLGVVSNVVDGVGAPVKKLSFDIERSRIGNNQQSNLRIANVTPVKDLEGKIQRSDMSQSAGTPVILEGLDTSGGTHAKLDFGGGKLGSVGRNCIYGGAPLDAELVRYSAAARNNWWGQRGGPLPGRVIASGGSLDTAQPLAHPPAGTC
jgi:hypothetical protein